ncbi:MAG: hypothetical protein OQK78_06200 [Gammaproteobacteria bacterium]|nr:hypothetical protein [Gammaproteobacteria bacterium]
MSGPSGTGKSELALALVDRGHRFVSDDVTLIHRDGQQLIGSPPEALAGMMQIHGCGLFNIKALYGEKSSLPSSPLQLIIELAPHIEFEIDPLQPSRSSTTLLGLQIPKITIPLPSPRNLPLVIELLVRKEIPNKSGYNAPIETA